MLVWFAIALAAIAVFGALWNWREKRQGEALKRYVLETTEIERRLAIMNPALARGEVLGREDQAWLESMLYARKITSDPAQWVRPDLGYDAISGSLGEFFTAHWASGGSPELLSMKAEQARKERMERMVAEIGMPQSQAEIDRWWASHNGNGASRRYDPVSPGARIYHAIVARKMPFPALYEAAQ